ncbi:MAG TPA: putative PEP-binding protein [Candidatus Dormibacteraeota bacterium]
MTPRVLSGLGASPGTAVGRARALRPCASDGEGTLHAAQRPAAVVAAHASLEAAACELDAVAARLRRDHHGEAAEIVETGALMGRDPQLALAVEQAIIANGRPPGAAIREATAAQAALIAALDDATLAARAADVVALGDRAARLVSGPADAGTARAPSSSPAVLVGEDLGPAEVAELGEDIAAIALAGGGITAHAAIVARSLGLPLVVSAGPDLLDIAEGTELLVDGDTGAVLVEPEPARVEAARMRATLSRPVAPAATGPARTRDGVRVRVLANVAGPAEVRMALDAGAEGVGLVRTELGFLDATAWPDELAHRARLMPILAQLAGHTATVRLLDFGGDKTPPFLRGVHGRGVELLLAAPEALGAQLRALLALAGATELRVLVPMVTEATQMGAVAALLDDARRAVPGARRPRLGAMIEVPAAITVVDQLAAVCDVVSIGTNDLTMLTLGRDRQRPGVAPAHHPAVLRAVAATVAAARGSGIPVEVCGEAAGEVLTMPLLVGLGVDELSVGAARVNRVRGWLGRLDKQEMRELAERALRAAAPEEVEALVAPVRDRLLAG